MKKYGMVWILCLFFILFCPQSVYAEEFVSTKNGLDVMFVMDYSGSMKTNDSQDIARGMVKAFVDTVHSADIRVSNERACRKYLIDEVWKGKVKCQIGRAHV